MSVSWAETSAARPSRHTPERKYFINSGILSAIAYDFVNFQTRAEEESSQQHVSMVRHQAIPKQAGQEIFRDRVRNGGSHLAQEPPEVGLIENCSENQDSQEAGKGDDKIGFELHPYRFQVEILEGFPEGDPQWHEDK